MRRAQECTRHVLDYRVELEWDGSNRSITTPLWSYDINDTTEVAGWALLEPESTANQQVAVVAPAIRTVSSAGEL